MASPWDPICQNQWSIGKNKFKETNHFLELCLLSLTTYFSAAYFNLYVAQAGPLVSECVTTLQSWLITNNHVEDRNRHRKKAKILHSRK